MFDKSDWIQIALAAPGVISLGWQIVDSISARREKAREKEEERESELHVVDIGVTSGARTKPQLRIRVCNRSKSDIVPNAGHLSYGIFGERFESIQFDSDTPFAVPVKPGHHRDLTLQLTPDKVPAVENHLTDGDIWVRISTTGGNFKDLRKDRIEFFLRELLAEAKRTAA